MSRAGAFWSRLLPFLCLNAISCSNSGPGSGIEATAGTSHTASAGTSASNGGAAGTATGLGGGPSGGTTGTNGVQGGAAGSAANADRGPTRAMPGVNFPFPQNRHSPRCAYPAYSNSDVRGIDGGKSRGVTFEEGGALRVKRMQKTKGPTRLDGFRGIATECDRRS